MVKKVWRATRRVRKAGYIHLRNVMREFPKCVYGNGRIFCRYSHNYPWRVVSFTFLSKNTRRYYVVRAMTAVAKAWEQVEIQAITETENKTPWVFPDPQAEQRVKDVNARCKELGKLPQEVELVTSLRQRYQGVCDIEVVWDLPGFSVEWMENFVRLFHIEHDGTTDHVDWTIKKAEPVTIVPQDVEPWPED